MKGKIKWQRMKTALACGIVTVLPLTPVLAILAMPSVQAANTAQAADSSVLNQLADKLQLSYTLTASHLETCPAKEAQCYRSAIELTLPAQLSSDKLSSDKLSSDKLSSEELNHGDWQIYFSQLSPVYLVDSGDFSIEHINGDLHKITPKASFRGFVANQVYRIEFYSKGSQITRSEFMPNFFVAMGDKAQLIKSTQTRLDKETGLAEQDYLAPFNADKQFLLAKNDNTPFVDGPYLAEQYQALTADANADKAPDISGKLIPTPLHSQSLNSAPLSLAKGYRLTAATVDFKGRQAAFDYLDSLGFSAKDRGTPLLLQLDAQAPNFAGSEVSASETNRHELKNEAYRLTVTAEQISIRASSDTGLFYGLQSLAGLISLSDDQLVAIDIQDQPRYAFRGLHIDLARNFHSLDFIKRIIPQLAAYKINKLHLHLADDEGWRLAIPGLPELTDVGAKRCFDLTEQTCLLPQLGSGIAEVNSVDGYLTVAQYQAILQLADAHHIEVIPSLDMPGHSRAAIKSMEARYHHYLAKGDKTKAEEFLLTEFADKTQYSSLQYYHDNTLNVCLPSTYHFIDTVIDEVKKMHQAAGVPLVHYHIGADETAGAWVDSPACIAMHQQKADELAGLHSLNGYFIERVANMLAEKGIIAAGWNDGMGEVRPENMPAPVQSNAWSLISDNGHQIAHKQVNLGWKVVISTPEVTYFDFPYESHPDERGNHWASRGIDSFKVFSFMPDNLPAHAERWHNSLNQPFVSDDSHSQLKPGHSFYGLQGHLWSEMVQSDEQAEYMLFPRMIALAERAWHKAPWELAYDYQGKVYSQHTQHFASQLKGQAEQVLKQDWQNFAAIYANKVQPKLAKAGIFYRIAPPGIRIENQQLVLNSLYLNAELEYQLDSGPWQSYRQAFKLNDVKHIRARVRDGARYSRPSTWQGTL
ncbi:family 20 glycosylhydrolase [Shewanella sp. CG12_big_fil_rev_8_21_14_0_65_47_15]|uniref:family 20 glycosylhydrolase n=1 Tax=Shewanella sp. CG12_big_fil_rev_8_21_14_0_65_47_15 TaxID=1975537 RepID=UPI000CA883CE|nr:family 20 glycosylhydrolase [Shewanella sp. CG12_big_fil_rev_8_21_14_0_65_47_15]PIW59077.1 MAG: beta-N-acetylhexosaminidase [Shewanella sp. CG12_big_fil_rev_8_21_14_0_65_47_15]